MRTIEAHQTISDIQANLTQKAYGYLEILDVLMDIQVVEHKGVSLLSLPSDNKFLQSLCTRLSKMLSSQSLQNEESDNSSDSKKSDEESNEQSDDIGDDTDDKEIDKLRKEFKEADKSVEEFIEELKEELQKNSSPIENDEVIENDKLGGSSTNVTTASPYRSSIIESLIQSYWTVSQVDAKRNYKKFLPKVWINPVTPYTFKTKELIDKPLVIFCGNGAGYGHNNLIASLKALPANIADTFMSDANHFDSLGIFKGERISLQEVPLPKKILVFTNGCDSQHMMTLTIKSLIEKGCEVEVFTMFDDHSNCGCPNFSHMTDAGIKLTRNLKVN